MKKYYGNYLGIVIDDVDPLYKNRIKIFIPAISATILAKLNAKNKNIKISQIGFNIKNALEEDVYEELKRILPWAECAAPLFGGGTSLHYNPHTKRSTNKNNLGSLNETDVIYNGESVIHSDLTVADNTNISTPGSSADLFTKSNTADILNENAFKINPTYTSMLPGGMFSTPKVNSHVWVFFNEGDPQYPIYFAHHIVYEDWQRIKQNTEQYNLTSSSLSSAALEDIDNNKDSTYTINLTAVGGRDEAFFSSASAVSAIPPSKANICDDNSNTVVSTIAQPGAGLIEFLTHQYKDKNIITDESGIKISTPAGGMLSIMSTGTTEYAAINKTTKVGGSYFLTVENCKETAVKGSATTHVIEDLTNVVGNVSTESLSSINALKNLYKDIATDYSKTLAGAEYERINCPICWSKTIDDSGTYEDAIKLREERASANLTSGRDNVGIRSVLSVLDVISVPGKQVFYKDIHKKTSCGNPNCVNNTVIEFNLTNQKYALQSVNKIKEKHSEISKYEENTGIGGNKTEIVAKNQITKIGSIFNDIEPYHVIKNAFPIKNGINFFDKTGISPQGDAVDILRDIDVPGIPVGVSENFIGTKYNLVVGSKGINIQTIGNVLLQGGNVNISGDSITLNNNTGLTKINGAAIILEATKSITLGGQPTNVHVNGSLHANANITSQGSIYSNNNIYAKRLIIPSSIQRTDTSSNPDYVTGVHVPKAEAVEVFKRNIELKKLKHYDKIYHGDYLSTELGLFDLTVDWVTTQALSADLSVSKPEGLSIGSAGMSITFVEPHIHLLHSNAHEHSFKGPNSFYLNNQDEIYALAATTGTVTPDIN